MFLVDLGQNLSLQYIILGQSSTMPNAIVDPKDRL